MLGEVEVEVEVGLLSKLFLMHSGIWGFVTYRNS